ncbi:MAG TPA: glycosyltransferase family 2 protein [Steroidobacteraceae bacterium]
MQLSIVVPLYNEEQSVLPMYETIVRAVDPLTISYEIIFIDDGSRDETFARAAVLAEKDRRLRVIKFRRNCGQTPAMAAGIDHACGEIIVTLDGDLQNDPNDIGSFLVEIARGYDIVVGWRVDRQDRLLTRKIPSRIANWLIGRVTGVPISDNGCSLKAYRAAVIKRVPLYSEMHRFIPAMASITGARIKEIAVRHHARRFGTSKYGLSRIWRVLLDLLTIKTLVSFASRPMRCFTLIGIPLLLGGAVWMALAAHHALSGVSRPVVIESAIGLISLAGGAFLVSLGVLAEMVNWASDADVAKRPLEAMLRVEHGGPASHAPDDGTLHKGGGFEPY